MPPPKLQWLGPPGTITTSSLWARILSRSAAAPGIFLPRELLPHGIAIKRRAEHVAERPVLVEAAAHLLPRHRAGGTKTVDVHADDFPRSDRRTLSLRCEPSTCHAARNRMFPISLA